MRDEGLRDGSAELSRKQVVRLVTRWIRQRIPAAVVRFGEGEGRLLVADSAYAESIKVATNKLRRQTGRKLPQADVLRVKSLVLKAFDEADVLGIRGSASFSQEHQMWVQRIGRLFDERLAAGRKPAYVSHSLLNNTLRDSLPSLLEGQRQVSVISCRDVKQMIRMNYGVEDVRVLQVPSQYVMREVDGDYEAALHGVPMWPDYYDHVLGKLSVRQRGEVFLVGAGLFGKPFCIRGRKLGGIALDLGSCLDGMANKVTRGPNRPNPYNPSSDRARRAC